MASRSPLMLRSIPSISQLLRAHRPNLAQAVHRRVCVVSSYQKRFSSGDSGSQDAPFLGSSKRLPEFSLKQKVVLVSGGARGLGLTQAEALLEAGATVYALDILPEPSPDFHTVATRAENELGTSLHYRRVDVRDVPSLNKIVSEIADKHGRMDGLIAAAGIQQETPALEYTAEDANRMFQVNITGVFMTAQAVAKQMIRFGNGGSIALIASMSGTVANRGLICPAYNASKAGVIQLGRNLASEWGEHRIRVNTISPGYIVTAMVEALFEQFPERRTDWPTQNMLGRLSAPREYRGAGVFLISDASSFMVSSALRAGASMTKSNVLSLDGIGFADRWGPLELVSGGHVDG